MLYGESPLRLKLTFLRVMLCAAEGEENVRRKLRTVHDELVERFRQLEEEYR